MFTEHQAFDTHHNTLITYLLLYELPNLFYNTVSKMWHNKEVRRSNKLNKIYKNNGSKVKKILDCSDFRLVNFYKMAVIK